MEKKFQKFAELPDDLLSTQIVACLVCHSRLPETTLTVASGRKIYCSPACSKKANAATRAGEWPSQKELRSRIIEADRKHALELKHKLALAQQTDFSPEEASRLRAEISVYLQNQLTLANEVVLGTRVWSPTQARVFSTLMNKVVPDLNASFVKHEGHGKGLHEYSQHELEEIIRKATALEGKAIK